jgi:hypothetical protein
MRWAPTPDPGSRGGPNLHGKQGSDHGACEPLRRRLDTARASKLQPRGGRMAAKFVLKKGSTGKFRFNLVAING